MEIGARVNAEENYYMATCRYQNTGRNHDIKISNKSLEMGEHFIYFGARQTDQNSRLKSGKCLPSFSAVVFSSLLSKLYKG